MAVIGYNLLMLELMLVNQVTHRNFSDSRTDSSSHSSLTKPIIPLFQDLMVIYIFTKFSADQFIFVDAGE